MIKNVFFWLILVLPFSALAATSDFTISVLGGEDTIPPTTPTLLSVSPVAPTQIDISWGASTDNYLLGGYVLLRDSTPIATTTLTTFIDSGLTAETLYTYEVYAFDSALNLSTTSNSLATTTPAVPIIPPAPTSTPADSSGTLVFRLLNIDIEPSINSALFSWQTSLPSRFALRWGRDEDYESGYIVNDIYRAEHQTFVGDLEPGTIYLYELVGYLPSGREVELQKGQFKTEARENAALANVQGLQAEVLNNDVRLSWTMPNETQDSTVRIVRSHLGYPNDPYDGAVIFEGKGTMFFDEGALQTHSTQYYTVFVIGADGSVSSGAITRARQISTTPTNPDAPTKEETPVFEEELVEIPNLNFSSKHIILSQGGKTFTFKSDDIELAHADSFVISIPYEALPKHLKSIIVTLLDPTDAKRSYSFLLRINKDRTAYEATIAPLRVTGASRIQVEIFDYEQEVIGRYRKAVQFVYVQETTPEVLFPDKIVRIIEPILSTFSMIALAVGLIFFLLYWRSRKAEDKQ